MSETATLSSKFQISIGQVLDLIAEFRPEATRDRRFNRLRELVAAR